MLDTVASRTAHRVAVRRAEHQVLDSPRLFEDPLSLRIIEPESLAKIRPGQVNRKQRLTKSFRAFMALRSRWAEDELVKAVGQGIGQGIRQYVILGAGLDTFAYRNPDPELQVFEVDHPATQAWKQERLAGAGIPIPASMEFVAAHFERESVAEALARTSFRPDAPAFFAWLGVIPYLTDAAFEETLRFVATRPEGSGIVFDYAIPRTMLNPVESMALDALSLHVANAGEPFRLFFEPEALMARLLDMGFHSIEDLGRDQMNARYYAGRADGLRVKGNLARLVRAGV